MTSVLIVPGLGGSGPEHWQTRWEALNPSFRRVHMPDWDRPELSTWVAALSSAVESASEPPLIVAHSLGCLAVAHWARSGGQARAALLVAVPDPEGPAFPEVAESFAPAPQARIAFPTLIVASRDDPYGSFAFAEHCASAWHSKLIDAGRSGHINAESGLGDWSDGRRLLSSLLGTV